MVRSGQTFTITFHENMPLANEYLHYLSIGDGSDDSSSSVDNLGTVTITNGDGDSWNSTEWVGVGTPSNIGSVSGKVLTIEIPTAALTITSSMQWTFATYFNDLNTGVRYMDITPNSHRISVCDMPSDGDGDDISIPGYELTILISVTGIFTIGIIYIHKKKNRFK